MQTPTGMKVLVATTTHARHKCRLFVKPLFDFIICAEFLVRIVFIFTFAFLVVSSGNLFSYIIFCSTFSRACFFPLVFSLQAHSIFRYSCHHRFVFIVSFKKRRSLFSERT
jgi:hypothetical protein